MTIPRPVPNSRPPSLRALAGGVLAAGGLLLTNCGQNLETSPTGPSSTSTPTTPQSTSTVPTTPDPDRRGDLVQRHRTLLGTIGSRQPCTLLTVGDQSWALIGAAANRLQPGQQVEVRGRITDVPPNCRAHHALAITQVKPR